jgi:CRP-like cAMP-binding protein
VEFIDSISAYVSKYVALTSEELHFLVDMFVLRNFKKRQLLVDEGEVEQYLNFVVKGIAIKYFRIKKKEVMVTQLARESELISSYGSFLSGNPSNYAVEALEHTVVASVTKENLERLYTFSPKMERIGRLITTGHLISWETFDYDRLRLSSADRFVNFVRNNPDLLLRVPQKHLASYLNMKPETFSRLKHLLRHSS